MNKTKSLIFDAAIEVFSEKGYRGATMDDIALQAGLAKGTLYYNFKSKEEIFNYVVEEGLSILKNEIEEVRKSKEDVRERIRAILEVQINFVLRYTSFFEVVISQIWGKDERQETLRTKVNDYIGEIKKDLDEAMQAGIIEKNDISFTAYYIFGGLCGVAVYDSLTDKKYYDEEVIEKTMNFIRNGIQAKKN